MFWSLWSAVGMDGLWEREENIHKAFFRYLARKQCSTLSFRIQYFLCASKKLCDLSGWCDCSPSWTSLCYSATVQCLVLWCVLTQTAPDQGQSIPYLFSVLLIIRKMRLKGGGELNPPPHLFWYTPVQLQCGSLQFKSISKSLILDTGKSLSIWQRHFVLISFCLRVLLVRR